MSSHDFPFLGYALWVDFLNTKQAVRGGGTGELIEDPDAFHRWAVAAGECNPDDLFTPDQGDVEEALRLRAVLREGAENLLAGRALPKTAIRAINERLIRSPVTTTLVERDGGWRLTQSFVAGSATALLGRIAGDFAQTLVSGRPDRLRRCEHPGCVMLFIDTSKNGKRRWCSMETCGNREKAAGHRARAKDLGARA